MFKRFIQTVFCAVICLLIFYGCVAYFLLQVAKGITFARRDLATLDSISIHSDAVSPPTKATGAVSLNNGQYAPPLSVPSNSGGR
jgi:hypothetical protein